MTSKELIPKILWLTTSKFVGDGHRVKRLIGWGDSSNEKKKQLHSKHRYVTTLRKGVNYKNQVGWANIVQIHYMFPL